MLDIWTGLIKMKLQALSGESIYIFYNVHVVLREP